MLALNQVYKVVQRNFEHIKKKNSDLIVRNVASVGVTIVRQIAEVD